LWADDLRGLLRAGQIDGAVHSLKDLDLEEPPDLCLAAFPEREDPRDAWVAPFPGPPKTAGTCSLRRSLQLAHLFPGIRCEPIRGTVQRRLEQVDGKNFDGTVLALAGLRRCGLEHRATRIFSIEEMLPCAGQGVLAVECQSDDKATGSLFQTIDCEEIREAALAERTLHRHLQMGLEGPLAVYAVFQKKTWHLWVKDFRHGPAPQPPLYHLWGPSLQHLISQMLGILES
jgi:hydroxymethylbilane synthase